MRKAIITLCFNRPEQVAHSIGRLNSTQDTSAYEKYLIDVSYPLPDKKKNTIKLANLAMHHGYELLKPYKNRGVAINWMHAVMELELKAGDVIIGMDPDSHPMTSGWCDALTDVLISDKKIGYCGLTRTSKPELSTEVDESSYQYSIQEIAGHDVRFYEKPVAWPMGGFNVEFVKTVGIHQPRKHYGFIEIETIRQMQKTEWSWCMLDKYYDATSERGEDLFRQWKLMEEQI